MAKDKAKPGKPPSLIEVKLQKKALVALDQMRGPRSREDYLSEWIEAHWRGGQR